MSNEKSLNEQLAELCGFEYTSNGLGIIVKIALGDWRIWNPTTDLNQLRMCYLAAEKDSEDAEKFESMVYWHVSEDLRLINKCFLKDITTAIFKHPELVARAILKAKEVS